MGERFGREKDGEGMEGEMEDLCYVGIDSRLL